MGKVTIPRDPARYGPGVVDPEVLEAATAIVEAGSQKYGPGVIDDHPDNQTESDDQEEGEVEALVAKYATDDGYLSISDIKELLVEMPSAFDRILGWEFAREDGPRIGALKHLKGLEGEKDVPRPMVLESITSSLAAAQAGKED